MCPAETPEGQVSVVPCANIIFCFWSCRTFVICFPVILGLWIGEESCIDGLHNRWICCLSYLGIFGGMGYWEFWGASLCPLQTNAVFVFPASYYCLDIPPSSQEISPAVIPQATKIFVNGCWVGIHRNPDMLVKTLRRLRRRVSMVNHLVATAWNKSIRFAAAFAVAGNRLACDGHNSNSNKLS